MKKEHNTRKQAGAELCQAKVRLWLARGMLVIPPPCLKLAPFDLLNVLKPILNMKNMQNMKNMKNKVDNCVQI